MIGPLLLLFSTTLLPPAQHIQPAPRPKLVYPYSVVPGGVEDVPDMFPVRLDHPLFAKASYRGTDGQIHATTKPVLIPAGELMFTDFRGHIIRARCGNNVIVPTIPLADLPSLPVPSFLPEPPVFEAPPISLQTLPPIQAEEPPAFVAAGFTGMPPYICCFYFGGGYVPLQSQLPVHPTPEPRWLGTALAMVLFFRKRML
jgi:hypothetical protein